jgi:putative transposase
MKMVGTKGGKRERQLAIAFPFGHGGKRRGAGRKPNGNKAGVSHLARPVIRRTAPVHVTMKMDRRVANLRCKKMFAVIRRALHAGAKAHGGRIVQFSVQGDHIHLLVEASSNMALSKCMQGFSVRVAVGLNRCMSTKGKVFADRFHSHLLRTPTEVRNARHYIRNNYRQHAAKRGRTLPSGWVDLYSSDGAGIELPRERCWLLSVAAHERVRVAAATHRRN